MSNNTMVNFSVDAEVKEQADSILSKMGLSLSDAFNLMLHQIRIQRALPFELISYSHIPKPETLEYIEQIENGREELIGPFSSLEELWSSLGI